ncbi:hypothetical protein DV495_003361 [Geotrichum candidum]|nr:hypothetical protein DV452_001439 [Geotrichum candidum]KAF5126627.1 hypothetical protein DV495_003361 [Geotrichum candidum]KAF7500644.1 hypothetical protein DV113_001339 [Geotrichum candidum]KAI8132465.1 hypothetical protein DUD61_003890 [Geotrichum candidum]KAI9214726.1 hypothetical protein DS838_000373 [Geotrichum bryndzae]
MSSLSPTTTPTTTASIPDATVSSPGSTGSVSYQVIINETQQQNKSEVTSANNLQDGKSQQDDDEEYDYEALPENTSLTANLLAGATAGIMVCLDHCSNPAAN